MTATRDLTPMLSPGSVAVIGASERNYYAVNVLQRLRASSYAGAIYPVNPSRTSVFDAPCYPSIADVPSPAEAAVVVVPREAVVDTLHECDAAGIKAAVIVASGMLENRTPTGLALTEQLRAFHRDSPMLLCGPACLGVVNVRAGFQGFAGHIGAPIAAGRIGLVSQSGAMVHAFIDGAHARRLGFSYLISSGSELDVDACDYLEFMLEDADTGLVCVFAEGLRRPERFRVAAERAAELGKPILILKLGRSDSAARSAIAHTGALTGSDTFFETLFRQHGVVRADTIDELLDRATIFAQASPDHWPTTRSLAIASVSGGAAGIVSDVCARAGIDVPTLSSQGEAAMGDVVPREIVTPQNPLDISGHLRRTRPEAWQRLLEILARDDAVDSLAAVDMTTHSREYVELLHAIRAASGKPIVAVGALPSRPVLDDEGRVAAAEYGIPVFSGIEPAVRGIDAAVTYAEFTRNRRAGSAFETERVPDPGVTAESVAEVEARRLLTSFGVVGPREMLVAEVGEVPAAVASVGLPLVMKIVSPDIAHRAEHGLVSRKVATEAEAVTWAHGLVARAAEHSAAHIEGVLVQEWVDGGFELIVGATNTLGPFPLVMVAPGGTAVELQTQLATRIGPIDDEEARRMLEELPIFPLLRGFRGSRPLDVDAAAVAIAGVSRFAWAARQWVAEVEINPLIVCTEGAIAADALIGVRRAADVAA